MSTELSVHDVARLSDLEQVIETGLQTFIEVGAALLEIRDSRLYRATNETFEGYCRERWGISKTHANRLIQAISLVENLTPTGVIPTSERQIRPLSRLEPEQREAWAEATKDNPSPTAKQVCEAAEIVAPVHRWEKRVEQELSRCEALQKEAIERKPEPPGRATEPLPVPDDVKSVPPFDQQKAIDLTNDFLNRLRVSFNQLDRYEAIKTSIGVLKTFLREESV